MLKRSKIEPHLNASKHGYAHNLRQRLKDKLITQEQAKAELNKRSDKDEIRQILEIIRNGKNN